MKTELCLMAVLLLLRLPMSDARIEDELTEERWEILNSLPKDLREIVLESMRKDEYTDGRYYKEEQELTEVPDGIPSAAIFVSLENNQLKDIPPGTFSNLSNLTRLILRGNKIEVVKPGMWEGLGNLEELDVSSNNIGDNIDCGAFQHLSSLKFLSLVTNKIAHINSCWWQGLGSLSSSLQIALGDNEIAVISGDMWVGLDSLVYLMLSQNDITELPPRAFANLKSIRGIGLSDNKLSTIPGNIFDADDYPETNGHPARLMLSIDDNPLQCDSTMCWIQQAEEEGWMDLSHAYPECVNYPDTPWTNITLCN